MSAHGRTSTRRQVLRGAGGTLAALALAACSSSKSTSPSPTPTPSPSPAAPSASASPSASPSRSASASSSPSASASASASSSGAAGAAAVSIKNFAFSPNALTVAPGTKITVTNQDSTSHTFTATGGGFDTGTLAPGASAVVTAPAQPGSYPFMCTIHPFMKGTLTVR